MADWIKYCMVVGFLTIFSTLSVLAQSTINNESLRSWSLMVGPTSYKAGSMSLEYGNAKLKSRPVSGIHFGVEFVILKSNNISINSGLLGAYEALYNLELLLTQEDSPAVGLVENNFFSGSNRPYFTLSAPLLIEKRYIINSNISILGIIGLKAMYFPNGRAESNWWYTDNNKNTKLVLSLINHSPENAVQGSFVLGTGISFKIKKVLIKIKLMHTINFQNTFEGNYWVKNLLVSEPTKGKYTMSGDYTGLQFSITLPKRNKSKRK